MTLRRLVYPSTEAMADALEGKPAAGLRYGDPVHGRARDFPVADSGIEWHDKPPKRVIDPGVDARVVKTHDACNDCVHSYGLGWPRCGWTEQRGNSDRATRVALWRNDVSHGFPLDPVVCPGHDAHTTVTRGGSTTTATPPDGRIPLRPMKMPPIRFPAHPCVDCIHSPAGFHRCGLDGKGGSEYRALSAWRGRVRREEPVAVPCPEFETP